MSKRAVERRIYESCPDSPKAENGGRDQDEEECKLYILENLGEDEDADGTYCCGSRNQQQRDGDAGCHVKLPMRIWV